LPAEGPSTRLSHRLRRTIELVLPELTASGGRLLNHPAVADLYAEYLFTSHCIVRASVPLMEAALERSRVAEKTDPVAAHLAEYLEHHIPEELHHDEWLLDDLETLGIARSAVLLRPPSPTVAALVGGQYYWIFHYHPVALLGYIEVLEGYPPLRSEIDDLIRRTRHSRKAFRTLINHAGLDPEHADELNGVLDHLPMTPEQSTAVGLSAMQTVHLLAKAVDEIVGESAVSA
jgi:hypothetical protein